jgi:L-lysine exporter family protein LysE/ArgO
MDLKKRKLGFRRVAAYRGRMSSSALAAVLAGLGLGLALIVAIGAQNAFVLRQGLLGEHVGAVVALCIGSDLALIGAGVAGAGAALTAVPSLITVVRIVGAAFLLLYGALAARRALRPRAASLHPASPQPPSSRSSSVPDASARSTSSTASHAASLPAASPQPTSPPAAHAASLPAASPHATSLAAPQGKSVPAAVAGGRLRRELVPVVLTCLALTWLNPHVYLDTVVLLGSVAADHGGQRWWFAAGAGAASTLWFCGLGAGAAVLRPLFARPAAWRGLDAAIAVVMTGLAVGLVVG